MTLLDVRGLGVSVSRAGRMIPVLEHVSMSLQPGEMLALVGESGSGKTVAALAMLRLLPPRAVARGAVLFRGRDVMQLDRAELRTLRGGGIGMVFQDALAALNPSMRVGAQIAEAFRLHQGGSVAEGRARAVGLLEEVGLDDPARCATLYPHQLSGGMRQRALMASALAGSPALLIADEPTSGLDQKSAGAVLAMLDRLRQARGLAVLLISHDLASVRHHADKVHVLYAGRSVEQAPADAFFRAPAHPYARALLAATPAPGRNTLAAIPGSLPEPEALPPGCRFAPRCDLVQPVCMQAYPAQATDGERWVACVAPMAAPVSDAPPVPAEQDRSPGPVLLSARDVSVHYRQGFFGPPPYLALAAACFDLRRRECLGVVGPSGCGKTSLGRAVLQMIAYEGTMTLDGVDFHSLSRLARRVQRRRIQAVFQDPRQSLNPVMPIADIIAEPLLLAGMARRARQAEAATLLLAVGLPTALQEKFPDMISGGQAQRVAIARALAARPDVLVLDEPTSSLDVSTQAGVLMLLRTLQAERGFATILISHDAAVVNFMADRVAMMEGGRITSIRNRHETLT